jgi:hypothetical protein
LPRDRGKRGAKLDFDLERGHAVDLKWFRVFYEPAEGVDRESAELGGLASFAGWS